MASSIVGLEITEEEVRAAEVTFGKEVTIHAHGSVMLPPGAAKDSEVLNRAAVVAALQHLWRKAGFKTKRVALGVVSRRVLVRDYRTQALAPDLLKQALPFQVADLLPVPADQAVIDFYPVSQEGDQLVGLLVAAVADTVNELVATLADAKLQVEQVDLAPFGLLRAVEKLTSAEESVAVVHLGPHTSYVVIAVHGVPRFVRIMPIEIPEAARRPDPEEDIELYQQAIAESVTPDAVRQASVDEPGVITQQRVDDLVSQIINTIRFYVERSGGERINRVFLTGAGAGIVGVHEGFQARISVPVTVVGGHHLSKQTNLKARHGQEDLELLTPVGLAMTGVK